MDGSGVDNIEFDVMNGDTSGTYYTMVQYVSRGNGKSNRNAAVSDAETIDAPV